MKTKVKENEQMFTKGKQTLKFLNKCINLFKWFTIVLPMLTSVYKQM